ncbi:DMT family transporter [Halopenitus sp. POP-27]|uniref:DMT family transporter n=1 Tax=Halopenitus sp. POP-27 TaxID=2994425 RepID=UPI0024697858|nr:DMT family transporter [Halopenitus sp. POP-27]
MNGDSLLSSPISIAAAFSLLAVLWGGSFVAIEIGLEYFPPLLFAGARYAIAGGIVLGYAMVVGTRWLPRTRTEWTSIAVTGVLVIAVYHAFLYVGELYVPAAIAAVVVSLSPVLTAAFAAVLLPNERVGPVEIGGFLIGILGVALIANPSTGGLVSAELIGVGLVLASAASFALGAVLLRPLRTEFSIVALQGWAMVVGAGLLGVGAAVTGESIADVTLTPAAIGTLAYLALLSGVVAFLIYFALLDTIGPTQLHLIGYAEPVTAAAASWLVLGHLVDGDALLGFLAILVGFLVLERDAIRGLLRSRFPARA